MKLSTVRFFFFPLPLNRSLMGSPIPNKFTQTLGFSSPIRAVQTHPRPDPPRGSDRRPIRNRPTRSFRRSAADLGFQNPKTTGRLAGFLFKTRRNPTEPRSQHFPAKLFTSGEISAISGDISARSMESSLDLARSH